MSNKRPTPGDTLRELGRVIQRDHGPTCIVAVQELQAAEKDSADVSTKLQAAEKDAADAHGASMQGRAAAAVLTAEREARAPVTHQERRRRSEVSEEFERRQALVKHQSFWAWLQHTDNTTHFKSKENLNLWSERPAEYAKWLKMEWVEFGCPGHGKGLWDVLGAMAKSKVTVDIMHGKEGTSTGQIMLAILVVQHFRAIFCNKDWDMDHTDMKIQQVVEGCDVSPRAPNQPTTSTPIVSPCKGIMSCFSFMFLGVPKHYARRSFSCW
jgi:hypothetical protein